MPVYPSSSGYPPGPHDGYDGYDGYDPSYEPDPNTWTEFNVADAGPEQWAEQNEEEYDEDEESDGGLVD